MKKLLIMMLFIAMSGTANAGRTILLLNAVTTTGAGSVESAEKISNWSCDATITGSPTAVTVRVEGSQGRTALFSPVGMASHIFTADELTATIASFGIADTPVNVIRGNLITLTGGTSPTVTVVCGGQ